MSRPVGKGSKEHIIAMVNVFTHIESTPIRVCFCVIFLILLALFIFPVTLGIVNLGNVVGVAISTVGFLVFGFNSKFSSVVDTLLENPFGKVCVYLVSTLVWMFILWGVGVTTAMLLKSNQSPPEPTNIIVLGCKVKGTRPSMMLRRRLNTAYEYLIENENVVAIVSGGKGDDEQISEAQCMRDYLLDLGIDEDRIIMEDQSTSTYENFKFSKQILEERSLPTDTITVITDGYHQLRASMIAKKLDFKTYSVSGYTSWFLVPTYFIREWFGVAYQLVLG